jgi:hypothetical protein
MATGLSPVMAEVAAAGLTVTVEPADVDVQPLASLTVTV